MADKPFTSFLILLTTVFMPRLVAAQLTSHSTPANWRAPAKLHKALGKERGELAIGPDGIKFVPRGGGHAGHWTFLDIRTFFVAPHRLIIKTYQNRRHHLPGERPYRFDVEKAIPPRIAAALAREVGRPSKNANPNPASPSFASLPAHHRRPAGGTNGTLRFRSNGIDYITSSPGDSRSWRWADIQTIAHPSPYRFTLSGYRETYDFDLKEPMSDALFDRLWDVVYGRGLVLSPGDGDAERIQHRRPQDVRPFAEID